MAAYRVYFSGEGWLVQEIGASGQILSTAAVDEVLIQVPCHLPPFTPGPRPNGVLRVSGTLHVHSPHTATIS